MKCQIIGQFCKNVISISDQHFIGTLPQIIALKIFRENSNVSTSMSSDNIPDMLEYMADKLHLEADRQRLKADLSKAGMTEDSDVKSDEKWDEDVEEGKKYTITAHAVLFVFLMWPTSGI